MMRFKDHVSRGVRALFAGVLLIVLAALFVRGYQQTSAESVAADSETALTYIDDGAVEDSEIDAPDEELDAAPTGPFATAGQEPRGAQLASRMNSYLNKNFPASNLPGLAVAVVDTHNVRYLHTFGDITSSHMSSTIGSLSKSMCALAIMQLLEAGKLTLDTPVDTILPEFGLPSSLTVTDLLNQTSGLGYYDTLAHLRIHDYAGTFSYANANYDLLGKIVERISGEKYAQYMQEHIFEPLGMYDSFAGDRAAPPGALQAPLHRSWFGNFVADGFIHKDSLHSWGTASSGYVHASIQDMASYLKLYLDADPHILSYHGVREILTHATDAGDGTSYAMGWTSFSFPDGSLAYAHDGDVENAVASMLLIPSRELAVVVLSDANSYVSYNQTFFSLASNIQDIALGATPTDIEPAHEQSTRANLEHNAWLIALIGCGLGLMYAAWHLSEMVNASQLAIRIITLFVLPALWVIKEPQMSGQTWRAFATFIPDSAAVYVFIGLSAYFGAAIYFTRVLIARTLECMSAATSTKSL